MKKFTSALLLFLSTLTTSGQSTSLEKSIFGIQTGFLGIWIYNESKISSKLAFRSEIGFDGGFFQGFYYDPFGGPPGKTAFFITPVMTIEPRWYYNLEKRDRNSKITKNNSGSFIGIKTSFNPDWFVISNYQGLRVVNQFSVIPKWGIRRNVGKRFNFESGLGIGVRHYFAKNEGYYNDETEAGVDLHLRFGYRL